MELGDMESFTYDLNPVQNIVADAFGEPGKRTFFLQGRAGSQVVTLVMEKQEVANLAISVVQLLEELEKKHPDLPPVRARKRVLQAEEPLEPAFRIGQLVLGYDEAEDMIWIIAKALIINEAGEVVDPDSAEVPSVRFVATREQIRALSEHALEAVSRGRPTCPLCGRAIDREGHFCPRSDGQAVPVVL
jgi:uncharacterized repeat protein (TIGR03847 family)